MQLSVSAPKENVAQKVLILISAATTKIKTTITEGLIGNKPQDEIVAELNKVIFETCEQITNPVLREETRKALVISSRKWYYQLGITIKILNRNLAAKVSKFENGVYTGSIEALLANIEGIRLNAVRPYLSQSQKGLAVIDDYNRKLKIALKALAAEPPKIVEVASNDETGRAGYTYTMSLRNRAEMTVRHQANMTDLQGMQAAGIEYVWITSHPDASPRCAPYQGKLYSLNPDNRTGVHNGIPYTYLQDVLDLHEGNSILNGYNCRHRAVAYTEGSQAPTEYTLQQIKREYAIDQRQRNYENNIREMKTEEAILRASGDLESARTMRLEWRMMTNMYKQFSLKMGRAFYIWRTVVSDNEKYYDENEEDK